LLDIQFIGSVGRGHLFYSPSCDSTQLQLLRFMESGAMGVNIQKNPLVLYTDVQTQGKGQRGNTWISEAGKNAMFTVAFPLMPGYENQLVLMNKALAAGLTDALIELGLGSIKIKWPNDLILNHMKVGGMLMEVITVGSNKYLFLGVGVNVNQMQFDDQPLATSLRLNLEKSRTSTEVEILNIREIIVAMVKGLWNAWDQLDVFASKYTDWLYRKEQMITLIACDSNEMIDCKLIGINEKGQISVELSSGEMAEFHHGEVKMAYTS
jgi:BirA family transcriptional regulator, biotin operon repressor / biotin---[acetyl-CoA-carboxylase] ligase